MTNTDNFDKFLKNKFQETKLEIEDNGFTEKVLSGLPAKPKFSINRNYILGIVSVLSILIFFISNGFKTLLNSMVVVFNNGSHHTIPSFTSVFVILIFISTSFVIAGIEFDESPV